MNKSIKKLNEQIPLQEKWGEPNHSEKRGTDIFS